MTPAQVIEDLPDPDEEDVRQVRRRAPVVPRRRLDLPPGVVEQLRPRPRGYYPLSAMVPGDFVRREPEEASGVVVEDVALLRRRQECG